MNTFFTLLAALFCLLTLSNAQPPGTVAAQCTVQVFGDLMQNGKGIRVSTYIPFQWQQHAGQAWHIAEADFGPDKAAVFLTLPIQGTHLSNNGIHINFKADYMYDLECLFSRVILSEVNTGVQINTSLPGTGKCFKISQQCKHGISTYGTVYIDMWCDVPGYPFGAIKMIYNSQGPEVGC